MLYSDKWKKTSEEWEEKFYKGIFFKRKINSEEIPLDCPVCEIMLVTSEDIDCYKEVSACESCKLMYYYPNKDKWLKGWRPEIINKR